MGAAGLLCHLLLLGGRAPAKILISRETGRVMHCELFLSYSNERGVLETQDHVPFRLTRNLVAFFSPPMVEGVFVATLAVAAQVGCTTGSTPLPRPLLSLWASWRTLKPSQELEKLTKL